MYEKLDHLIISIISNSQGASLSKVTSGDVYVEAQRIAQATKREEFRVIDGRLQALRKRGLIAYVVGAWRISLKERA